MPTPTIPAGNLFMNATLWTGDGATSPRTITNGVAGQSFQPDLVWSKDRTSAYNHQLFDSVRGTGSSKNLMSNDTAVEGTNASSFGFLSAFNSNGFSLTKGTDPGNEYLWVGNTNDNYVAWQWKAGGTAVSNTAGTISSQVSANTTSGFSIVTYTGNATGGATVGHGCQVNSIATAPSMIILKSRSLSSNWYVYHSGLTSVAYQIYLNFALAEDNAVTTAFNSAAPGATTFALPGTGYGSNNSGATYVAYCFAQVAGYSAFGSYTGNGSSDGPFVYLGFRPKFVMIKRTDSSDDWILLDTSRSTYNVSSLTLYANGSYAEDSNVTNRSLDFLSNGFKIRSSGVYINASGGNFIYMAFAENPFKYANAR